MRKVFAVVFLALYVVALFKPVAPMVYYYLNYDYIVETLCEQRDAEVNTCQGMCHLKKNIAETAAKPVEIPKPPTIDLESYPVSLTALPDPQSIIFVTDTVTYDVIQEDQTKTFNTPIFHPPKA